MGVAALWAAWDRYGPRNLQGPHASPLADITFPTTALIVKVWIALGADLTADSSTWAWEDITIYVRHAPGINITVHRRDQTTTSPPGSATLTLDNFGGTFSRRNPYSPFYGLLSKRNPIRIAVNPGDGDHIRYEGYVVSWPTRWTDKSLADSTVPIQCGGFLRIAAQDTTQLSALRRTNLASNPVAYWSLEDPSGATLLASGVSGGTPIALGSNPPESGVSGLADGASAALDVSGTGFTPLTPLALPAMSSWSISWVGRYYIDSAPDAAWMFRLSGPVSVYVYVIGQRVAAAVGGSIVYTDVVAGDASGEADPHHFLLTVAQNGSDIDVRLSSDGSVATGGFPGSATLAGTTNGSPTGIVLGNFAGESLTATLLMGHLAIFNGTWSTNLNATPGAVNGYNDEPATDRVSRLAAEAGVSLYMTGSSTVTMGPQPFGTWLNAIREAESADNGLLYENGFGLGYQASYERLEAPVGFELDFEQGQIAELPEPADDDSYTVNRVVASNSAGSEAVVEDAGSISADGLHERPASANVPDEDLDDQAGWRVWLGTVDVDRWPRLDIHLARSPELIPTWTSLRPGTRTTAANPPDEVAPDDLDTFAEGWTEFIQTPRTWRASLFTSPARPYDVGVLVNVQADQGGYLDYDSCALAVAVDDNDTSWSITCSPADESTADAFPRSHWIGGELVTVTASTGGTSPTWTVTRSVNGVTKSHPASPDPLSRIELADPLVLTL